MISGSRPARTLVASVLFVDLVEFSRASVAEQIEVKRALTRILQRTLSTLAEDDYRLMDTGDGAALGFLADPEHALYFALAIDAACRAAEPGSGLSPGALRIGINLGPVKDVFDVNDRPSLIGDGMNTAQRIVGFAQPGQITISRSFFELVSRLAPEYRGIFVHIGAHDDKHGREHDLYVIKPAQDMLGKIQERLQLTVAEATGVNVVFSDAAYAAKGRSDSDAAAEQPSTHIAETLRSRPESTLWPISSTVPSISGTGSRRRPLSIGLLAALVLVGAVILTPLLTKKATRDPSSAEPTTSAPAASSPGSSPTIKGPAGADTMRSDQSTGSAPPATASPAKSPMPASDTSSRATPTPGPRDSTLTRSETGARDVSPSSGPSLTPAPPKVDTTGGAAVSGKGSEITSAKRAPRASSPAKPITAPDDKPRDAPTSSTATKSVNATGRGSYTRCSTLMQKTSLGETLTTGERREMEEFCR